MPELSEVEKAAAVIRDAAQNKIITRVETVEDTIVYTGTTNEEFAEEITGRTLLDTGRYGKLFYLTLDGEGRMPVLHLGMTGMLQVRGEEAVYYRKKPKQSHEEWPPKFMKFILHFSSSLEGPSEVEIALLDPRRLGRIRLVASPLTEPPISTLGFDPLLSMLPLSEFSEKVLKRGCPIKALLLDQSFSAGVGNWIADEVLFHSEIHPEQVAKTLTPEQIKALHHNIVYVCKTAVEAEADHNKFPDHWLFLHRWGKGKSKSKLILPSGEEASIKWITVGGRTSAVVQQVQKLNAALIPENKRKAKPKKVAKKKAQKDDESDLSELTLSSESETAQEPAKKNRKTKRKHEDDSIEVEVVTITRKRLKTSKIQE